MSKILKKFKKILASTEEIDVMLSSYLKMTINGSRVSKEVIGNENLIGLQPEDGKAFYACICEPENFRGMYNVCREPVRHVAVDKLNPDSWKVVFPRKACEKAKKVGVCRRALIKVDYLS